MKSHYLLFILIITIASCKSAQEKYNDQNYKGAFDEALGDLKKGKDKSKNLTIIKKSLRQIVAQYKQLQTKLSNADIADKVPLADANIDLLDRMDKVSEFLVRDTFYRY